MNHLNEKLGLGDPPVPVYLYVKLQKTADGVSCWYTRDHDADVNTPVPQRALTGYLREITMNKQAYKNDVLIKLNFKIQADRLYVVRTGVTTEFARGAILGLYGVDNFASPVCLAVQPGDEVVFAAVYQNGERQIVEANDDVKLFPIIQELQERLGQSSQTMQDLDDEFAARSRR